MRKTSVLGEALDFFLFFSYNILTRIFAIQIKKNFIRSRIIITERSSEVTARDEQMV